MTNDKNTVAMGSFIASESVFFALLIIAYIDLHGNIAPGSPSAASVLDVPVTSFYTACLISSSFTLWKAENALRREKQLQTQPTQAPARTGTSFWLSITILLGATFLFGQAREYRHLYSSGVTVGRNLFATSFFTLTGFHGLHVFIGLIMLLVLAGVHAAGDFRRLSASVLEAIGLYWHFVDVVWIVLFSIIYLRVLG
jgi:heme/copper-type cytochrome/quinol oxidase subunit 3